MGPGALQISDIDQLYKSRCSSKMSTAVVSALLALEYHTLILFSGPLKGNHYEITVYTFSPWFKAQFILKSSSELVMSLLATLLLHRIPLPPKHQTLI